MNWSQIDWKLVITLYAALVSTFVAVWRIYEFFEEKIGRLNILVISGTNYPLTECWDEDDKEYSVIVTITNVGKKARYIKTPYFNVSPKMALKEHTEMLLNEAHKKKPQVQLMPGEEFRFEIPMWLLVKYRKAGAREMQAQVKDSHGKLHKSKWRKL